MGTGTQGYSGDGGNPLLAQLDNPGSVELDPSGNLYIGCSGFRIRKIGDVISCSNSFLKAYRKTDGTTALNDIIVVPGNSVIIGGLVSDGTDNADAVNSFLMKLTNTGEKLWEKTISLDGNQWISHIIPLRDGNYLAVGADKYNNGKVAIFLLKFDVNGNTVWRRTYQYNFGTELFINKIQEDVDGSIIAVGNYIEGLSFHDRYLYLKFDKSGTFLLAKSMTSSLQMSADGATDVIIKDGFSYISGIGNNYYNYQGALLKIDNRDGKLVWSKYYSFNNGDIRFSQIFPYSDDQLLMIGVDNLNSTDTSILVRTDLNGNVLSAKYMRARTARNQGTAVLDASGHLIWFNDNFDYVNSEPDFSVTKVHPQNGIEWVKEYPRLINGPNVNSVAFGTDSSIFFIGGMLRRPITLHLDRNGFAGRLSKNGNLSCASISTPTDFGDAVSSAHDFAIIVSDKVFTETIRNGVDMTPQIDIIDTLCYQAGGCISLSLTAQSQVCQNDTVFVHIQKACISVPDFEYDSKQLQLVEQSDTLLKFKAIGKGEVHILSKIINDCQILADSVDVLINPAMGKVNLGGDTTLCAGNTLILNARRGYKDYLWQDGSTDSTFTVQQPGLYYVTTSDACGRSYYDTIIVNAKGIIPFDIGPDRAKCNDDTLHLHAPPGFLNYSWGNNYNINSTTSQNVIVNPFTDTAYYVKAEKTPGCFAYDTVKIKVNTSPSIILGPDKSFCKGDSAVFDAGGGFNQYVWNNGSNTQQISVRTAGIFSVMGITVEGCKTYDTVRVVNVFPNPVVSLEHTDFLCTGSSRVLNAGNFSSYLWSNGSTAKNIVANDVGIYAVQVTDANGCKGTDTTRITTILPSPSNFLPGDTLLCSYDKLTINPLGLYNAYQWNNNATVSSITVSQPGTYWLQVKDANDCVGRDSIVVNPKDCMKGCYVPTAFSPNNDGKNDVFRPMLFGHVKKFQLIIYNRWGQIAFQTTELNRAWDGKIAGVEQDPGVFVWVCHYQFEGEEEKTERGTVMLVK